MTFFSCPHSKNLFHGLSFILLVTIITTSAIAAELRPFPPRDRAPQYQQSAPRYRQPQPTLELEQFRRDIVGFPCLELNALYDQIRNQFNTAETVADREYYSSFLNELYREKSSRCPR